MSNHRYKSSFGQCFCLWCGSRGPECKMTFELRTALVAFADENGRTWKSKLRAAWENGTASGPLQVVRNVIGPRGLARITNGIMHTHRQILAARGAS